MSDRFSFLVAVHLFLLKDGKVLLLRRHKTGYEDGNYSVPAGHVDGGEKAKEAMVREALEEVGLKVKTEDLEVAHVMHRLVSEVEERIDFFFTAENWQGEPKVCEPEKCDQLKWVSLDKLPKNVVPYIRFALEKVGQEAVYSEFIEPVHKE